MWNYTATGAVDESIYCEFCASGLAKTATMGWISETCCKIGPFHFWCLSWIVIIQKQLCGALPQKCTDRHEWFCEHKCTLAYATDIVDLGFHMSKNIIVYFVYCSLFSSHYLLGFLSHLQLWTANLNGKKWNCSNTGLVLFFTNSKTTPTNAYTNKLVWSHSECEWLRVW